jgi:hypothetical protein
MPIKTLTKTQILLQEDILFKLKDCALDSQGDVNDLIAKILGDFLNKNEDEKSLISSSTITQKTKPNLRITKLNSHKKLGS